MEETNSPHFDYNETEHTKIQNVVETNVEGEGDFECPLCGNKVKELGHKNKTIACKACLSIVIEPIRNLTAKVGRNDPCPCGAKDNAGNPIKFKRHCGKGI